MFVTIVNDRSCSLHMSIAVAAEIKNSPNADNMKPANWISEAAILGVPLKWSYRQCPGVVKWQRLSSRLSFMYASARNRSYLMLTTFFSRVFVQVSGKRWWWQFPTPPTTTLLLTKGAVRHHFPIILRKQWQETVWYYFSPGLQFLWMITWWFNAFFTPPPPISNIISIIDPTRTAILTCLLHVLLEPGYKVKCGDFLPSTPQKNRHFYIFIEVFFWFLEVFPSMLRHRCSWQE